MIGIYFSDFMKSFAKWNVYRYVSLLFLLIFWLFLYFKWSVHPEKEKIFETQTAWVVHVEQYWAVPDDNVDDTLAIRSAFEAIKNTWWRLVFAPWEYRISWQEEQSNKPYYEPLFVLEDYHNLEVDGQWAFLNWEKWWHVFSVTNSSHITFKNLSIWFELDPPFTAWTVVKNTSDTVEYEIEGNHPVVWSDTVEYFVKWDFENKRPAVDGYWFSQVRTDNTCTKISETRISCTKEKAFWLKVGDENVILFQKNWYNWFNLTQSTNISLENIFVTKLAGLGIVTSNMKNLFIDGFTVKPTQWHFVSVAAWASNLNNVLWNLDIQNYVAWNQCDDWTNVHTKNFQVVWLSWNNSIQVVDPYTWRKPNINWLPFSHDAFQVYEPGGLVLWEEIYTVNTIDNSSSNYLTVTLDQDVQWKIFPWSLVVNVSKVPRNTRISNIEVRDNRWRWVLIAWENVLVENSFFVWSSWPWVQIHSDHNTQWGFSEGRTPSQVYIIGNTFDWWNYGHAKRYGSLSMFTKFDWAYTSSDWAITDIHICNNTFQNSVVKDIWLNSWKKITLSGNHEHKWVQIDPSVSDIHYNTQNCDMYTEKKLSLEENSESGAYIDTLFSLDSSFEPNTISLCSWDASHFQVSPWMDGRMRLLSGQVFNYEAPTDQNGDNVYEVCLRYDRWWWNIVEEVLEVEIFDVWEEVPYEPHGVIGWEDCTKIYWWACDESNWETHLPVWVFAVDEDWTEFYLGTWTANISTEHDLWNQCGWTSDHRFSIAWQDLDMSEVSTYQDYEIKVRVWDVDLEGAIIDVETDISPWEQADDDFIFNPGECWFAWCVENEWIACFSETNACWERHAWTILCDGSCSLDIDVIPELPEWYWAECYSAVNECWESWVGMIDCSWVCVASVPQAGDSDQDGVADCQDSCPFLPNSFLGTSCDDGNSSTVNDVYTNSCKCLWVEIVEETGEIPYDLMMWIINAYENWESWTQEYTFQDIVVINQLALLLEHKPQFFQEIFLKRYQYFC